MRNRAVCIRCGSFKQSHDSVCPGCAFEPTADRDIAKSRILDFPWSFAIGNDGDVVETGRSMEELKIISAQIKDGQPYAFPEAELDGVLQAWMTAKNTTTPRQLVLSVVKWIAPPLALGAAFGLLLLWKSAA